MQLLIIPSLGHTENGPIGETRINIVNWHNTFSGGIPIAPSIGVQLHQVRKGARNRDTETKGTF